MMCDIESVLPDAKLFSSKIQVQNIGLKSLGLMLALALTQALAGALALCICLPSLLRIPCGGFSFLLAVAH